MRTGIALALAVALVAGAYILHASPDHGAPAAVSLMLGAALGLVMERGRFCFFCIFRELIEERDSSGMYSVLTALAVGAVGYALVFGMFLPDAGAGRLPTGAHIGPVSWVLAVAGVAFGVGMALSGACISGHLYRLGEGYGRAIPALLGSLVGFGVGFLTWNDLYLAAISGAPVPWLPAWLGYGGALMLQLAVIVGIAALLWRFLPARAARAAGPLDAAQVRRALLVDRWPVLVTGAAVGIISMVAYLRVEPLGVTAQLASISRTVLDERGALPTTLFGLDRMAGCVAVVSQAIIDNGWLIIGLVLASLAAALTGDRFRPTRVTVRGGVTALAGGALMGWASMVALGCTVGVLLSGIHAFALAGWVFFAAVFAGVWLGVRLRLHRLT